MTEMPAVVYVVDDDPSVLRAVGRLLRSAGIRVELFASAREFLAHDLLETAGCLVLDVQLPDLDGLELQRTLEKDGVGLPIVFVTGHGDIPMSVQAMKAGAIDFLSKPFDEESLLNAVREAIARDTEARRERANVAAVQKRAASLTPRERQVVEMVLSGMRNKQIGHRLGVTEKTVKVHRGQVMRKMNAGSVAELVWMAQKVDMGSAGE
jgi:FixJ family two-component response regulator